MDGAKCMETKRVTGLNKQGADRSGCTMYICVCETEEGAPVSFWRGERLQTAATCPGIPLLDD